MAVLEHGHHTTITNGPRWLAQATATAKVASTNLDKKCEPDGHYAEKERQEKSPGKALISAL